MQIRLIEPQLKNWLLVAEGLNDPQGWNRFVPCHDHNSERFLFEGSARETTAIKLNLCKELLVAGSCSFEYSWDTAEDDVLEHAMDIAEKLGVELIIGVDVPLHPHTRAAA
ncbi:MAG: hypothetical protein IAF58_08830 [Leptolyngbya sp.]|nr:hypothetical protein [Candidatus Melainabacteria bacterium]